MAAALAHSLHGALPHAVDEAQFVHALFGGTVCVEDAASRSVFQEAPTQILHIATHAEYRQQQPIFLILSWPMVNSSPMICSNKI